MSEQIQNALKKVALFSGLPEEMISQVAEQVGVSSLSSGEVLFHEGDKGDALYFIQSGELEISRKEENHDVVLAVLGTGEYFGEMALLEDKPRTATVTALKDSELLCLGREEFVALLESQPSLALKLTSAISARMRLSMETGVHKKLILEPDVEAHKSRVFISYSRRDKDFVQKLHDAISEEGVDTWVDWENIPLTADWWAEIQRGIAGADAFAFVISPDSLESEVCYREIQEAVDSKKRLVPILYRDPGPAANLHPEISSHNWVFMRTDEELETNVHQMLKIIGTDLEWVRAHTRLLERSLEWDGAGRNPSFLLRGEDLANAETWLGKADQVKDLHPTPLQEEYIRASRQDTKRRRRLTLAGVAVVLVFGALLVLSVIGFNQARVAQGAAESARGEAVAQQLTAEAASTLAIDQGNRAIEQADIASTARAEAEAQKDEADRQRELAEQAAALEIAQRSTAEAEAELRAVAEAEALTQADLALSRQRAAQALSFLESQPDLASLLSVESYRTSDTLEAKSALLTVLQRGLSRQVQPILPRIPIQLDRIFSVALSPDDQRLAWGTEEGEMTIWNYQDGIPEHGDLAAHGNLQVWTLAFSPDGETLASAGADSNINLWDVASGELVKTLFGGNQVLSVDWSPDGNRIAFASGPRVAVWEVATGDRPVEQNLGFAINEVAWSPDGRRIAAASADRTVYVLDAETGGTVQTLRGHTADVLSVAWGADSNLLVSGAEDGTVRLWDIGSGVELATLEDHEGPVVSVSVSRDGGIVASGSVDRTVILWDTETFEPIETLKDHSQPLEMVDLIPKEGDILLATAGRDKTVGLFEVITDQPLSISLGSGIEGLMGLSLSPEGLVLAVGSRRSTVDLWEVDKNTSDSANARGNLSVSSTPMSAALSLDGTLLAIGFADGTIQVVDPTTNDLILDGLSQEGSVFSLAFSQDGRTLASSCGAPDDELEIPVCDPPVVTIWDLETGQQTGVLTGGHIAPVRSLAFSPDGGLLASGGEDQSILIRDLASGEVLGVPLVRHQGGVTGLAFSPAGNVLASGGEDNTIILWDMSTDLPIGEPLVGSTGAVVSLIFDSDGSALFAGNDDGVVFRWEVDVALWLDLACSLAGRNMTTGEWNQFIRDEDYRVTCEDWPAGE